MEPRQFHLGDILSVTTDRLVALDGIGAVYRILNYMTGDNLMTHQLPRAAEVCGPALLEQHPQLNSGEMQFAVGELLEMLKTPSGNAERDKLVTGWLCKLTATYGETLPVKPLTAGQYEHRDPIEEAVEIMGGPDRVLVVERPLDPQRN